MAKSKKTERGQDVPAYEDDKFSVELKAPSREALGRLLQERNYDPGHLHPRREDDGIEATLYLTRSQIDELREEGWSLKVGKNFSAVGRERQREVGDGDRFEGGKVPPKGLGTKRKPRN